jgi:hypothetical protein
MSISLNQLLKENEMVNWKKKTRQTRGALLRMNHVAYGKIKMC